MNEAKARPREKAVVLLSGGIDSSVTLAQAKAMAYDCVALAFDYNQRHSIELRCAENLAAQFHVPFVKQEIIMPGKGPLLNKAVPRQSEVTSETNWYVPGRNLVFLSYALTLAVLAEAYDIFFGANLEDYDAFPDCRRVFFDAFQQAAFEATGRQIRVQTPFYSTTKRRIVELAAHFGINLDHTWSCYNPQMRMQGEVGIPCGVCTACQKREAAIG